MKFLTDVLKKHWRKIVFGLILIIVTFGMWLLYKSLVSKKGS